MADDLSLDESLDTTGDVKKSWLKDQISALINRGLNLLPKGTQLVGKAGAIVAVNSLESGLAVGGPLHAQLQPFGGYCARKLAADIEDSLTLNLANAMTYCGFYGRVNKATAVTITLASDLPDGFVFMFRQVGAGQVTIAGSGLTNGHRLSHAKSAGQKALCGVLVDGSEFVVFGDTAA